MNELFRKLSWSLPWLTRYPFWRLAEITRRWQTQSGQRHLIITIADHFEPSWSEHGFLDLETQLHRVDEWCEIARKTGDTVRDHDGTPFRHTNFYPAEQYHRPILDRLTALQAEGFGEVEVHLHHGVTHPDDASNLRCSLETFRDILAEEHHCLSQMNGQGMPRYAFVHGNLALANSAGGQYCGVDSEMQILAETGCYADFTLPSAPQQTQVPRINAVYECKGPLDKPIPHWSGPSLRIGKAPKLPILVTGPLTFNWQRRISGLPIPRLDDGVLAANYPVGINRLERWANANISVKGRPEWVFVKLYCHGFFAGDQDIVIGEKAQRFWLEVMEYADKTGRFRMHFASAREVFNIALAATNGCSGDPNLYRDYALKPIMNQKTSVANSATINVSAESDAIARS